MNKKLVVASVLLALMVVPVATSAVPFGDQPNTLVLTIPFLLNVILTIVWYIFIAIVIILFIAAGIMFLTAQGNPEAVATARKAVIWGTAGVLVGILAFSIISIVGRYVGTNI